MGTAFKELIDKKINGFEEDYITETAKFTNVLMNQSLNKDWKLNDKLTQLEMANAVNKIIKYEKMIHRYRRYFGYNTLRWTPSERRTVSTIYYLLSEKYKYIHFEEGYEKNKLISDNLLNNPLNKIKRFNMPSAPRGPNNIISVNTFKKFVDGD